MKKSNTNFYETKRIAAELDARMENIPHFVGVCIEKEKFKPNRYSLSVCIDNNSARRFIPKHFHGYEIDIKVINSPQFAS